MSNAAINPAAVHGGDPLANPNAGNHHDPHLAHHFDTPEQQYASAKIGMWVFLGTEILMFGGLFCGYAVYRHNHPDVFAYAHHYLNKWLGGVNTLVLITSSLTMAWAVRAAQLGQQTALRWLMAVTILGGYIFLGIKSVEYHTKWQEHIFIGAGNRFRSLETNKAYMKEEAEEKAAENKKLPTHADGSSAGGAVTMVAVSIPGGPGSGPEKSAVKNPEPGEHAPPAAPEAQKTVELVDRFSMAPPDPNAEANKGADAAKIRPNFADPRGMVVGAHEEAVDETSLSSLSTPEQKRLYTFFGVYFFMTGLHGVHVVIGMSLIFWVLLRSLGPKNVAWAVPMIPASVGLFLAVVGVIIGLHAGTVLVLVGLILAVLSILWAMMWAPRRRNRSGESEFGPTYFTPVDLVGLYWHLVDLIWIFLFPLLYLIH